MRGIALIAVVMLGCSGPSKKETTVAPPAEENYLHDTLYRKKAMSDSLTNHSNTYSRHRLAMYGYGNRGWDALPVWRPVSTPVNRDVLETIKAKRALKLTSLTAVVGNLTNELEIGEAVFWKYPIREEPALWYALADRRIAERLGIQYHSDGSPIGVVAFRDIDGGEKLGITCAFCHASQDGGRVVAGRARRTLDYGRLDTEYSEHIGVGYSKSLRQRMLSWGPGRADVTEDDDEDPVAIPDLWGLKFQSTLTQAATIQHHSVVALALRQETQYIHANGEVTRPPRPWMLALAKYLYSLTDEPDTNARIKSRGADLFITHCSSCHSNQVYGGPPVPFSKVGTDAALAIGTARGTGMYRVPSLLKVCSAAPYFHDGSAEDLDAVISTEGVHDYAASLNDEQKNDLKMFLCTL